MRIRDRILHATAGWHTTTDPACVEYKPTREGSGFDARSRGVECLPCLQARMVRAERPVEQPQVTIVCPECDARMPVPIHVRMQHFSDEPSRLVAEPDMTDVWAHAWTHTGGDDE